MLEKNKEQLEEFAQESVTYVCHGPLRCTKPEKGPCIYCYKLFPGDTRSSEEIQTDMMRVH